MARKREVYRVYVTQTIDTPRGSCEYVQEMEFYMNSQGKLVPIRDTKGRSTKKAKKIQKALNNGKRSCE